jgi:hypothetical protein
MSSTREPSVSPKGVVFVVEEVEDGLPDGFLLGGAPDHLRGEAVFARVLRGFLFAFRSDGAVGFGSVDAGGFGLLVGDHCDCSLRI